MGRTPAAQSRGFTAMRNSGTFRLTEAGRRNSLHSPDHMFQSPSATSLLRRHAGRPLAGLDKRTPRVSADWILDYYHGAERLADYCDLLPAPLRASRQRRWRTLMRNGDAIGSGLVEGKCKFLVARRFKGSG